MSLIDFEIPEEMLKNKAQLCRYLSDIFFAKTHGKTFMNEYNQVVGFYVWDGRKYVDGENLALNFIENVHKFFKLDEHKIMLTRLRSEFMHHLMFYNIHRLKKNNKIIAFNNVVFDWDKFLQNDIDPSQIFVNGHDPNIFVFNVIEHDLDTEPLLMNTILNEEMFKYFCPKSHKTFTDWVGEKWITLLEIIGYCLYPEYTFNKSIMLVGSGSNGKSTYLRLIKTILGSENISAIELKELIEDRFAASELYGKLANIYADLPVSVLRETGKFKILTGEDVISTDRKFKGRLTFMNHAKLIFSCNELPRVYDLTPAFWRRWIVLEFKNKFEPREGFFEETFTEDEISKLISLSLIAFKFVLLRGSFSFEEDENSYKEFWMRRTDTVYAFFMDALKSNILAKDPTCSELKKDVYSLYVNYCEANEITPVEKITFTKRLEMMGVQSTIKQGQAYYKGIKIVREKETPSTLASLVELGQPKTEEMPKKTKLQILGDLYKTYGKQTLPLHLLKEKFSEEEINKMVEDGDIALLSDDKFMIMRWEE